MASSNSSVTSTTHWESVLPATPTVGHIILIGKVTDAKAFLSEDKKSVYTSHSILIEDVLKNDDKKQLEIGSTIEGEREGGIVKFSSGFTTTLG